MGGDSPGVRKDDTVIDRQGPVSHKESPIVTAAPDVCHVMETCDRSLYDFTMKSSLFSVPSRVFPSTIHHLSRET